MKKRFWAKATIWTLALFSVLGVIWLAGFTTSVRAAAAHAQAVSTPGQTIDSQHVNEPVYDSSIKAPVTQDAKENDQRTTKATKGEDQPDAALQALAKITPDQAKAAALAVTAGTVTKVDLDDENGNVVYGVEVMTRTGTVEVKVDAGNGQVLAQQSADQDQEKGVEKVESEQAASASPDLDQVQEEHESETR